MTQKLTLSLAFVISFASIGFSQEVEDTVETADSILVQKTDQAPVIGDLDDSAIAPGDPNLGGLILDPAGAPSQSPTLTIQEEPMNDSIPSSPNDVPVISQQLNTILPAQQNVQPLIAPNTIYGTSTIPAFARQGGIVVTNFQSPVVSVQPRVGVVCQPAQFIAPAQFTAGPRFATAPQFVTPRPFQAFRAGRILRRFR